MPTKSHILLISCFLTISLSFSQSDSLKTAQLLDSALYHPDKRDYFLQKVSQLEKKNKNNKLALSSIWLLRAKYELRIGNIDGAKELVNFGKKEPEQSPKLMPYFFSLEGSIFATQKQFDNAIESYQNALRGFDEEGMKRDAAYVKNNIANIFFNINDFESAYSYAKESFDVVYLLNDTIYYPQIVAILAISEVKTNRIKSAEKHANQAISDGKKYKLPLAIIIGNYALGDVFYNKNNWEQAKKFYSEVVALSEQMHLTQYETYGRIGLLSCNIALKLYDQAIAEGEKAIELNNKYPLCICKKSKKLFIELK